MNPERRIQLKLIECPDPEELLLKGPTEYYIVQRLSDGKNIGTAEIRLELNDYMKKYGGNIGYFIDEDERNKGYGTEVLAQLLVRCGELDMKSIMITCYENNQYSKRMIEKAGGHLESVTEDTQGCILHYRMQR